MNKMAFGLTFVMVGLTFLMLSLTVTMPSILWGIPLGTSIILNIAGTAVLIHSMLKYLRPISLILGSTLSNAHLGFPFPYISISHFLFL